MAPAFLTSPSAERAYFPKLSAVIDDPAIPAESRFLHWLTRLPLDADVAEAARAALQALERQPHLSEETCRLRSFLRQAATPSAHVPRRRFRGRH